MAGHEILEPQEIIYIPPITVTAIFGRLEPVLVKSAQKKVVNVQVTANLLAGHREFH
ncbi:MAG: hypothetical protein ABR973_06210 [Candidatus Acidiferrales bacterium]